MLYHPLVTLPKARYRRYGPISVLYHPLAPLPKARYRRYGPVIVLYEAILAQVGVFLAQVGIRVRHLHRKMPFWGSQWRRSSSSFLTCAICLMAGSLLVFRGLIANFAA